MVVKQRQRNYALIAQFEQLRRRLVYRADDRPTLGGHRLQCHEDVQSHVRVESGRRLVEEQQVRVCQHLPIRLYNVTSKQRGLARNTNDDA